MQVRCPAHVVTGAHGELLCVSGAGQAVEWEPVPPIDLSAAAEPFSVGFLLVASFWALGHGVAVVLDLVRR